MEQLIINRQKLKSAVIISNVETKITLSESNGIVPQVISVAEAIEMKKSIHLYKEVLNKMSKDYKAAKGVHEDKSAELDDYLQTIAQKKVGFDMSDAKDTKEAVNSMRDFIKSEQETRTPVLVDPIKITSEIERYSEFISEFESEIDRKLSISNAITEIEVAV